MFDFFRRSRLFVYLLLSVVLLALLAGGSFLLYDEGGPVVVATVNGEEITEGAFSAALSQRQAQVVRFLGEGFDPAQLDSPAFRLDALQGEIDRRLLQDAVRRYRLEVPPEVLARAIYSFPQFQVDGAFSAERYKTVLQQQRLPSSDFEAQLKNDIVLQQLVQWFSTTGFYSNALLADQAKIRQVARVIRRHEWSVKDFLDKVSLKEAEVKAFYDGNQDQFGFSDKIKVRYIRFSLDELLAQQSVSKAEIEAYYDKNEARYQQPDQRKVSHILFQLSSEASEAVQADVLAKAQGVLDQLKKEGVGQFEALAKRYSDDAATRDIGGNLGPVISEDFVPEFSAVAFALSEGDFAPNLVRTPFGYHIVYVTEIYPTQQRNLDAELSAEIEQLLKTRLAHTIYDEQRSNFSTQADQLLVPLEVLARDFSVTVRETEWLHRDGQGVLDSTAWQDLGRAVVLDYLFDPAVIADQSLTPAIDLGEDGLLVAQVMAYQPGGVQPFSAVESDIRKYLQAISAQNLAEEAAQAAVSDPERLEQLAWSDPFQVSLSGGPEISSQDLQAIFGAVLSEGAVAYSALVEQPESYVVYRVEAVEQLDPLPEDKQKEQLQAWKTQLSDLEFMWFLQDLRDQAEIEINLARVGAIAFP